MAERRHDESTARQAVVDVITEILPDVPANQLTDQARLRDLGADSVEQVEIMTALKSRFGIVRNLPRFTDINNVGELISWLSEVS